MAEMADIQQRLSELYRDDPDVWMQGDESESIRVSVDGDGKVDAVRFAQNWWQRVRPEDAGAVVLTLVQASRAARGETATELGADDAVRQRGSDATSSFVPLQQPSSDRHELMGRLETVLTAFAQLDTYRQSVMEAARETVELRSPSGEVTLEVVGTGVRRLTIDARNAQFTPEAQLEREIVDLFARAREQLDVRQQEALDDLPELSAVVREVHAAEGRV